MVTSRNFNFTVWKWYYGCFRSETKLAWASGLLTPLGSTDPTHRPIDPSLRYRITCREDENLPVGATKYILLALDLDFGIVGQEFGPDRKF